MVVGENDKPVLPYQLLVFRIQNRNSWSNCCLVRAYYDIPLEVASTGVSTYDIIERPLRNQEGVVRYIFFMKWRSHENENIFEANVYTDNDADTVLDALDRANIRYQSHIDADLYLSESGDDLYTLFEFQMPQRYRPGFCGLLGVYWFIYDDMVSDLEYLLSNNNYDIWPDRLFLLVGRRPVVYTTDTRIMADITSFLRDDQIFNRVTW